MSGYVRIHRTLIDHPAFRNDAESMAFAWMIAKAAWAPRRVRYKERCIQLTRGQLAVSQRDMARAMDRDKAWIERLWKRLKSEAMIGVASEAGVAVITICNYDEYQAEQIEREAVDKAPRKAGARQGQGTEQEREETKRNKSIEIPDWMPLELWADFTAMRLSMRNVPFGNGAQRLVVCKLTKLRAEGHCPAKLLAKAIERGHRSVFEDDNTKSSEPVERQLTVSEKIERLQKSIAFYERQGRFDEIADCRRRIEKLRQEHPPDSKVVDLVSGLAKNLAA